MSTQQATLHVSGMTCNNCTRFVDNTLRDLTGVETTKGYELNQKDEFVND